MKRMIIASLLVSATQAFAAPAVTTTTDNVRLVNADASMLSEICIAAVESRNAAIDVASELKMTGAELDEVYCNGMPLAQFVRTYRAPEKMVEPTYILKNTDATALTEVCMASVKSEEEFAAAKAKLGEDVKLDEVHCNNMPLADFARRYRKTEMTASIQ
jgi:hypothetical protein